MVMKKIIKISLAIILCMGYNSCVFMHENIDCSKDNVLKEVVLGKIDTSSIYRLIELDNKDFFINSRKDTVKLEELGLGLRFYNNGKVIEFRKQKNQYNEGKYCIKNGKINLIFSHKHVQGNFTSIEELEINGDTIIGNVLKSPQTKKVILQNILRKDRI